MKFKYKVLFTNLILLSIALGITGYLIISKNFKLTLNSQIQYAIEENNFIQAAIEYNLLEVVNNDTKKIPDALNTIGKKLHTNFNGTSSDFYIMYNSDICYSSNENSDIPDTLFEAVTYGYKQYTISRDNNTYCIYTLCATNLNENDLYVITSRDITDAFLLKDKQLSYFRILLIFMLCICSLIMYIISHLLTKPIADLSNVTDVFASGDYTARSTLKSNDEIGHLANAYNHMAEAVDSHVNQLNDMIKSREQFVADFTHEIKTPMTSIIGYADTIRSKELKREQQIMAADYIFSEGKRLENMSMKLFDLIYLNNNDINKAAISTSVLGEEVVKSVMPALKEKDIRLEYSFQDKCIYGDMDLLKSMFINLIDNARKASKAGSVIEFTGYENEADDKSIEIDTNNSSNRRKDDKNVEIAVSKKKDYIFNIRDYGTGISEEHLAHIYDEFYMVDKSRSRKEGGAGLGLSLVSVIARQHNADIHIDSKIGEGTCFSISFEASACH
jgi:signal transduction histidine kinase